MANEELSVEESRARGKALDSPVESAHEEPAIGDLTSKEDKSPSMWRVLLQLRVLLPYLSRLVPLLDGSVHQATNQPRELPQGTIEGQANDKLFRVHLQDQTLQMQRVDEQLERLRETTERNTREQQELIEDLKSFRGTIKTMATIGILLLLLNSGVAIFLLLRLPR